jgi:agmatinase
MYEPWNALEAPRFTGPRTYARLPWVKTLEGVEAAVYGLPWDGGTSFRSGARFGPEAIRSASGMIRTYNPVQRVQVFGALSTIDYGDAPTAPGYIEETLARMERFVAPLAEAGVVGIAMGGDHSVTLAELRALARVHGPLGLVHLDSHTDLWDTYNGLPYSHGTMFRRAIIEGIVDPARVIQAGMRGSLYGEDDENIPGELGVETIPWIDLVDLPPSEFADRARLRVADKPAFLSLDVDFVDAAFCPGTGTPEVAGPSSFQAMQYLRALADIDFVGYDVVEVAPQYDGPGQATALFASGAIFEMLSMVARRRRSRLEGTAAAASARSDVVSSVERPV